jgi:hypothetical protein
MSSYAGVTCSAFTDRTCVNARMKAPGILLAVSVINRVIGQQRWILPDRLAVATPEAAERPSGKRFAGIPLALTRVQQGARSEVAS